MAVIKVNSLSVVTIWLSLNRYIGPGQVSLGVKPFFAGWNFFWPRSVAKMMYGNHMGREREDCGPVLNANKV